MISAAMSKWRWVPNSLGDPLGSAVCPWAWTPGPSTSSKEENTNAVRVPRATSVSMLAVPTRALAAALRRNGHPAHSTTGTVSAAAVQRAHPVWGHSVDRTRTAMASGQATTSRRSHRACSRASRASPSTTGSRPGTTVPPAGTPPASANGPSPPAGPAPPAGREPPERPSTARRRSAVDTSW